MTKFSKNLLFLLLSLICLFSLQLIGHVPTSLPISATERKKKALYPASLLKDIQRRKKESELIFALLELGLIKKYIKNIKTLKIRTLDWKLVVGFLGRVS